MAGNTSDSQRTKHIDLRYHFVRDLVLRCTISLQYCRSDDNTADVLTKPLSEDKVAQFRSMLGVS